MADERITSKLAIPKGVRVFPPEEAAVRLAVQERLLSVFQRWGFREVITPAFEYLEVFTEIGGEEQDEKIFTFVDRQTGRLLALRYDLTPQVARMVATSLRHRPLPLRQTCLHWTKAMVLSMSLHCEKSWNFIGFSPIVPLVTTKWIRSVLP